MRNTSVLQTCSVVRFLVLTLFSIAATATDTITTTQPLKVGQTLVSAGEEFELGFFSPNNSTKKFYLGIWYKRVPQRTVVWVANRDNPGKSSTVLKISRKGNIILIDSFMSSAPLWYSSNQMIGPMNTVAQILDSGNFVLRWANDSDPANFLWQSFDYPTDTLMPGMRLGWDSKTGLNRHLRSWKASNHPSSGDYSLKWDLHGLPQIYLRNKEVIQYRTGPWTGVRLSGVPEMKSVIFLKFSVLLKPNEITYSFELTNKSDYFRLVMNPDGVLHRYTWIDSLQRWNSFWHSPKDQCDSYKECGTFGVCDTDNSPVCQCVHGFEPRNPKAWALRDGSDGCVRVSKLGCAGDGFLMLTGLKLPDTATSVVNSGMSRGECEKACLKNCSCTAFSMMDIGGGGSACLIWIDGLIDMRHYPTSDHERDLFVRVAASDLVLFTEARSESIEPQLSLAAHDV